MSHYKRETIAKIYLVLTGRCELRVTFNLNEWNCRVLEWNKLAGVWVDESANGGAWRREGGASGRPQWKYWYSTRVKATLEGDEEEEEVKGGGTDGCYSSWRSLGNFRSAIADYWHLTV